LAARKETHVLPRTRPQKSTSARETPKEFVEDLSALINKSPDIIFTINRRGRFLFVNQAVQKITGYSTSKLLKCTIQRILAPKHKDSIKKYFRYDAGKVPTKPLEVEIINSGGKKIPLEIHFKRETDKDGSGILLRGFARDITERKKLVEKFDQLYKETEKTKSTLWNLLYNAANLGFQGYKKNGEIVFWNRYSEKLFGYTKRQATGNTFGSLLLSSSHEREFKKYLRYTILNNKPSPLKEWKVTKKSGEVQHVWCSIFPAIFAEEEPLAMAVYLDITDSKRAKEKLKTIYQQLSSFSEISADILSIEDEKELFRNITQAVVDISDFKRVLISYFINRPPFRQIIGSKGIKKADMDRVKKVRMPRDKYLKYFEKGIKLGNQSCYIPHTQKGMLDKKALIPGEKLYPEKAGSWHREDNLLVAMKDSKGKIIGIISVDDSKSGLVPTEDTVRPLEIYANLISEIILKHKLAKKIGESEEKYRELVTNIKIGILRATPKGKLLEANPSAVEMFGYIDSSKFLKLHTSYLYQNPDDSENLINQMKEEGIVKNKEFKLRKRDGTIFWGSITATPVKNRSYKIIYYDTVVEDISERKKLEEQVLRLSITDDITDLYNRRHFNQTLPEEIKTAERWKSALSLVMVDIDDFKICNDKYLHLVGDKILKDTAHNLKDTLRKEADWSALFGWDEFSIVLPGTNSKEAAIVGERIRDICKKLMFRAKGDLFNITISAGVATFSYSERKSANDTHLLISPTNYEKIAQELTRLADDALFQAKRTGKDKVVISKKSIMLSRKTA
jgi:diguanylate cyclase (GGDEF)-like protein/PAS domain S-box-containing protein